LNDDEMSVYDVLNVYINYFLRSLIHLDFIENVKNGILYNDT